MNAPVQPHHRRASDSEEPVAQDLGFALPAPASITRKQLVVGGTIGIALLCGAFALAYVPRRAAGLALERSSAAAGQLPKRVAVIKPTLVSTAHAVPLTGDIQPLEEAVVYARANGFIHRWLVDMGAQVEAGALLAEIESPEVDQELAQARAALAQATAKFSQAQATRELSQTTFLRTRKLLSAGVASQQELEQSEAQSHVGDANLDVAQADINAQRANIRRLTDVRNFSRVVAPFAGTIAARNIELGSLVSSGTTPLFRLASTKIVRILVQVPQNVALAVSVGLKATVRIREFPGTSFEGTVAHTSGVLDPISRTLSAEIRVPNPDGKLLAGMYAEAELNIGVPYRQYELPATALMSDAAGLRVAVVNDDNRLQFRNITLDRDLGPTVQISRGLAGNEHVVQIASAEFEPGQRVEVISK